MLGLQRRQFAAQAAGIAGHDFVAVGDHGFQGFFVRDGLDVTKSQLGRHGAHLGQTNGLHHADVEPAHIKFVRLDRELGRGGVGVVVVVQLFTANDDAPDGHIGRRILRLKIAVTGPVAQAIDDAGGHDRNPEHLHRPDGHADQAEKGQVDDHHQGHALP